MSHTHNTKGSDTSIKLGLILNTGFTIVEFIFGSLTGSLALIADATHNLTDSLTLCVAFIAEVIGRRGADNKRSYGYGRAKIIASLLNAGILVAIAVFIGYEAIARLNDPKDVPGLIVAFVAAIGIVINGSIAYMLSKQKHNLNARSAYINMFYDTLSSVGALLAGFAIALFGWTWLDSVVGILIAVMLLYATRSIIKDAIHVLLEGVPEGVDIRVVKLKLLQIEGVIDVDDIHAWAIDNDYYAFSCHLVISESNARSSRAIVEQAKQILTDKYQFNHTTIEVEPSGQSDSADHVTH